MTAVVPYPTDNSSGVEHSPPRLGLSPEEDDELRRLHYFQQVGTLSGAKLERFLELRLRDRREEIRPPREFGVEEKRPEVKVRRRVLARRSR